MEAPDVLDRIYELVPQQEPAQEPASTWVRHQGPTCDLESEY